MMKRMLSPLLAALLLFIGLAPAAWAAPGAPQAGWQTLMSENFEGTWPGGKWSARAVGATSAQYWGKASYNKHAGTYAVWPAAGGPGAITPGPGTVYPNYINTQMIYGPFDLSDALDMEFRFWMWMEVEEGWDFVRFFISHDGNSFMQLQEWTGNTGEWSEVILDTTDSPELAGYKGDNSVWVRWDFTSDESNGMAGPYIDDVSTRTLPLLAPSVTIRRSGSDIFLEWPANPDAAQYEVWRGVNSPYFTPGANCAASSACAVVTTNAYTHTGGSGSVTDNTTYVVRAVNGSVKSVSNRTGEFDFALVR